MARIEETNTEIIVTQECIFCKSDHIHGWFLVGICPGSPSPADTSSTSEIAFLCAPCQQRLFKAILGLKEMTDRQN